MISFFESSKVHAVDSSVIQACHVAKAMKYACTIMIVPATWSRRAGDMSDVLTFKSALYVIAFTVVSHGIKPYGMKHSPVLPKQNYRLSAAV
jgi:hypothetical protein